MRTLIVIAVAALLWLVQFTLGSQGAEPTAAHAVWLSQAALAASVLAAVLVLQALLRQVLRGPGSARAGATTDLLQAVLTVTLYLVATMLYLRFGLGQDISSVLATSAMLSVIVGLALQPTLGHLFAGVAIEIERPLQVGDCVRRDDMEGEVVSLNWRSVYLRTIRGSTILMPNSEFTSRLVEVVHAGVPYRYEINFNVGSEQPPGQVIRIAMQALQSGLPGVCAEPKPSVVLLGNDPGTGMLRYTARLYTLNFLARTTVASGFLERLWYALSREGLALQPTPGVSWQDDAASTLALNKHPVLRSPVPAHAPTHVQSSAPNSVQTQAPTQAPGEAGHVDPESDEAALDHMPGWLLRTLRPSALTLRYGRLEQCEQSGVSLLLEGRLYEDWAGDQQQSQTALVALLAALEHAPLVAGPSRLSSAHVQALQHAGLMALGPLAGPLALRIAALTDAPSLAYRAFAESIESPTLRAQFLADAPQRSNRTVRPGDWLGWAQLLGLDAQARACHASRASSLLVWPAATLRKALGACTSAELAELLQLLRTQAPGCETLSAEQLQGWLQSS